MARSAITISLILLNCLVVGCDGRYPETVPVHGVVTWNGQPLDSGVVSFRPVQPSGDAPRRPSVARLRSDGSFEASSYREGDGLVPGTYQVAVMSFKATEDETKEQELRIPQKYARTQTSGLTLKVPMDESSMEVRIDLTK